MSSDRASFRQVKDTVSMEAILEHYDLLSALTKKPKGFRGRCPFHDSKGSRSFHVSSEKNVWYCFGCRRGGNILDFVSEKESVGIPEASQLIAKWFRVEAQKLPAASKPTAEAVDEADAEDQENATNALLRFPGLKGLDVEHSYLRELGFEPETVEHFESGFCRKGLMKGRVAIAIHNRQGGLLGYAGLDPKSGQYIHPDNLSPLMEIYNLHRQEEGSALVVVTDYLDVWKLRVAGIKNAVALFNGRLSRRQEQMLEEFKPSKLLLLQTTARDLRGIADRLIEQFFLRHQVVPTDTDLTSYRVDGLS